MNRVIAFLVCFFISYPILPQKEGNEFAKFHRGSFRYLEEPYTKVVVKRTKRSQIESESSTGIKIKYRIRWTSQDEYELKQVKTNTKNLRALNGTIIKVKILEVSGNSYKYEAEQAGFKSSYTMVKISK